MHFPNQEVQFENLKTFENIWDKVMLLIFLICFNLHTLGWRPSDSRYSFYVICFSLLFSDALNSPIVLTSDFIAFFLYSGRHFPYRLRNGKLSLLDFDSSIHVSLLLPLYILASSFPDSRFACLQTSSLQTKIFYLVWNLSWAKYKEWTFKK